MATAEELGHETPNHAPSSKNGLPTYKESATRSRLQESELTMIVTFITENQEGFHTYTGHIVSRGPTTIVVLLTEPFSIAGRSVQFPITDVVSEKVISA
jgi:hypothetical protein